MDMRIPRLNTPAQSTRTRLNAEQLEDRSVPAAITWVNDNWNLVSDVDGSGTLTVGDIVNNANDPDSGPLTDYAYGTDAFGTVTSGPGIAGPTSVAGAATIGDTINNTDNGGTVNVLDGTYTGSIDLTATGVDKSLTISPSQGAVNIIGDLKLNSDDALVFDIYDGDHFDQIRVMGEVALNGATLDIRSHVGFYSRPEMILIHNGSTDPVVGTFAGWPEGESISYTAGTGNDVALPAFTDVIVPPPTQLPSGTEGFPTEPGPGGPELLSLPTQLIAVGVDAGANGHVKAFQRDGSLRFSFVAFDGFTGGVRVATGDVNSDGFDDIIVGAGTGASGGHVKVFDGATGNLMASFFSFDGYTGGVNVAAGDVDGDGYAEVIVGTGTGSSHVKAFQLFQRQVDPNPNDDALLPPFVSYTLDPKLIASFLAFDGYTGGVTVTAGEYVGAGGDEIVVGSASGSSHVKVFDAAQNVLASFIANPGFTGGINVAMGRLHGDDVPAAILVAPATGTGLVQLFSGGTGDFITAFDPGFAGNVNGIRVAVGDVDGDGAPEILTATGPGQDGVVKAYNKQTFAPINGISAFPGFFGGLFVGNTLANRRFVDDPHAMPVEPDGGIGN